MVQRFHVVFIADILPLDYSEYADRLGEEFDKLEGIWADDPALSEISLEDVRRELALFRNGGTVPYHPWLF